MSLHLFTIYLWSGIKTLALTFSFDFKLYFILCITYLYKYMALHLVHGHKIQFYPELPPSPWFQGGRGNNSHIQFDNTFSSVLTTQSNRAVENLSMASNGQKRAASDSDKFKPSSADKRKAKKQNKKASRPASYLTNNFRHRQQLINKAIHQSSTSNTPFTIQELDIALLRSRDT